MWAEGRLYFRLSWVKGCLVRAQLLSQSRSFFTLVLISKQPGCQSQADEAFAGVWQHKERCVQWREFVDKVNVIQGQGHPFERTPLTLSFGVKLSLLSQKPI